MEEQGAEGQNTGLSGKMRLGSRWLAMEKPQHSRRSNCIKLERKKI